MNEYIPSIYIDIDDQSSTFEDLDPEIQEDLLEWYNAGDKIEEREKDTLLDLYQSGRFQAWDCPTCGDRIHHAEPKNWNIFQNALTICDHSLYPPNDSTASLCNPCHAQLTAQTDEESQ